VAAAFDKGIECILNTQIMHDGRPTIWCQQHDRETLQPAGARAYELPSFCPMESAAIVQLLMELEHPGKRVKRAVTGLVPDSLASPLWARFYDLVYGEPFVCDRDGIPRRHLEQIGSERRNGYAWYGNRPARLYPLYRLWVKKHRVRYLWDVLAY